MDKRIRKQDMQRLRWSSSVFPGVLRGEKKTGDRLEMGGPVKVVLNLRSAPLNQKRVGCKDKFEAKFDGEKKPLPRIAFPNNRSNSSGWRTHVNTSTDKHCILGIRPVLRLAQI